MSANAIKRILFIGDPFRGEQAENILRVQRMLSCVCAELGLRWQCVISDENRQTSVEQWLPGWQRSMARRDSVLGTMDLAETAVIGFELPETEKRDLDVRQIPWMDLTIHPIRFLDDLCFHIETSFPFDTSTIGVTRGQLELSVQSLRLRYGVSEAGDHPRTLAIFGQTPIDRSIYFDGEFRRLTDYLPDLDRLACQHERVIYRPHPYMSDKQVDTLVQERFHAERHDDADVYRWMVSGDIDTACAISSSVLYEAPCFGIESVFLEPRAQRAGHAVSLPSLLSATDLWKNLLPGVFIPASLSTLSRSIPENFVRRLYSSWSFVSREQALDIRLGAIERQVQEQRDNTDQAIRGVVRQHLADMQKTEASLAAEHARAEHLATELQLVFESRSWRTTAPLRWGAEKIRGLRSRLSSCPVQDADADQQPPLDNIAPVASYASPEDSGDRLTLRSQIKRIAGKGLGKVNRMLVDHPALRARLIGGIRRFPWCERKLRILLSGQYRGATVQRQTPAGSTPSVDSRTQFLPESVEAEWDADGGASGPNISPLERSFRRYRDIK